jgi:hypothetical protein
MELFECALDFVRGDAEIGAGFVPPTDPIADDRRFHSAWTEYLDRLDTLPSLAAPGYVAQMAAPPHPAALLGYFTAMLRNPNNHDTRFAAATMAMEREAVSQLAAMFGFVARRGHPTVAAPWPTSTDCGAAAGVIRITPLPSARMPISLRTNCRPMGVEAWPIWPRAWPHDLNRLEDGLRHHRTVVVSAEWTGAVDPIDAGVAPQPLRVRHPRRRILRRLFAAASRCRATLTETGLSRSPPASGRRRSPQTCVPTLRLRFDWFRDGDHTTFAQHSPYTQAALRSGLECCARRGRRPG